MIRPWIDVRCGLSALNVQHMEHCLGSAITESFCVAVISTCSEQMPYAESLFIASPGTPRPASCSIM